MVSSYKGTENNEQSKDLLLTLNTNDGLKSVGVKGVFRTEATLKDTGKVVELRRWYCGRKLSAAFDEYIKQTANNDDEIKTMQAYAALVDSAEKRIAKMLKEGAI
jgi:hypothetical protein|nr:MAG TPA: hypothetical protein [Caudoviricetes sp.]